ncbi:hypothetical protein FKM82_027143, partial [Ascaphus truei]
MTYVVFLQSYTRSSHVIVTLHPLQTTMTDFWRLVYDYGCSSIIMLNQLNQSNSAWPCLQYWPDSGISRYGPLEVQFVSGSVGDDVVTRLFRVQNITRDHHLLVKHFQYLRWSPYRDTPDTKRSFMQLLSLVGQWQEQDRESRTVIHCLYVLVRDNAVAGKGLNSNALAGKGLHSNALQGSGREG